jgi:integrase
MTSPKKKTTKLKEPVRVRTKKLADGSESLYLDIYVDGKRSYEFLKLYLLPEVNAKVKEQNRATRAAVEAIKSQRIIDITNGKAGIKRTSGWQKLLLADWLDRFKAAQKRKGIRNIALLGSVIKVVALYGKKTRMGDIDKKWALGFIDWLQNSYNRRNKVSEGIKNSASAPKEGRISQGTAVSYVSQLSIALNAAVRAEVLGENPFMLLSAAERVKKPESQRQFLTIEELKKMTATECSNPLVKQAYLFSCYCGLRMSDIYSLKWKDVQMNDGRYLLSVVMKKTSTPVYIPLSNNALAWLPERNDDESTPVFSGLPSLPTINRILKGWAKSAGIGKHITYHTSRHTFGTLMMTVGADLYTTCKLMGHSDVRTTQIYAKIVDSKKIEAVNLVDRMFEKRNKKKETTKNVIA